MGVGHIVHEPKKIHLLFFLAKLLDAKYVDLDKSYVSLDMK